MGNGGFPIVASVLVGEAVFFPISLTHCVESIYDDNKGNNSATIFPCPIRFGKIIATAEESQAHKNTGGGPKRD